MRRASVVLAALGALGLVAASRAAGAQTTGGRQARASVLSAIAISGSDLDFGTLLSTQTKTVAPPSGGRFLITTAANQPVSITYALPGSLSANVSVGSYQARVSFFNSTLLATAYTPPGLSGTQTVTSSTGDIYIWLGATISTTGAAPGTYSAPITLTVVYN